MELEKYIQNIGEMIPNTINLIIGSKSNGKHIAFGKYEYPETIKELFQKIKIIWKKSR